MDLSPDKAVTPDPAPSPVSSLSTPVSGDRWTLLQSEGMWLAVLYLVTVLLHIVMLWHAFEFPIYCTDAVVYVSLAESIRHGTGYLARGALNSSVPPLYPFFLAILHSLGNNPRVYAFIGSCVAISLGEFPCYWLARRLGLDKPSSFLLTAACGFLPHTFFAAIYMTETLQFPLFMAGCYFAYVWLSNGSRRNSTILGLLLAALLLNKVASLVCVFAFLLAMVAKVVIERRRGLKQCIQILRGCGRVLGVSFLCLAPWYAYKLFKGGSILGHYGTEIHDQGLRFFTLSLTSTFVVDYFLAAGLITAGPLIYYFYRRFRLEPAPTLFFAVFFFIQILWVGVVDGGLTGMLRERLLSFSMPLAAILAVRGFVELRQTGSRCWMLALIALPVLCLAVLYRYDFHDPSSVEFPWAYSSGAVVLDGLRAFVKSRMVIVSALAVVAMLAVCCCWQRRTAGRAMAGSILLFHLATFITASALLSSGNTVNMGIIAPMKDWLVHNSAGFDQSVLVASTPAYYEGRLPNVSQTGVFEECMGGRHIDPFTLWQMETYLRWDVRTVCGPADVARYGRPGEILLTEHEVEGPSLVSESGPYRLYKMGSQPTVIASMAPVPMELLGSLDLPKPGTQQKQCVVGGWAFCRRGEVESIPVYLDGVKVNIAAKGGRRPDVEAAFIHDPEAALSGFYTEVDLASVTAGKHVISVKVRLNNGELRPLGKDVEIQVLK